MDKFAIGEITLIFLFYILLSNHSIRSFLLETIIGHILIIIVFVTYYYLDKYISIAFGFMIVFIHYNNPIETFYSKQDNNQSNNAFKSEENFRKTYCIGNELLYKGKEVKNDMVEHVFPEINFKNNICNPCDKKCNITIVEQEDQSTEDASGFSTLA
jgi:hypothetical protein